ncbi:MAG TPA: FtsX-like permease family protein, partial [Bryobacteraceae bacterium]|nr:FtsX-like permease family protein [Bryobacteraceae bacterium]
AQADPKFLEGWTSVVYPFAQEDVSPTLHLALYTLLAAVGFLLLIACANLANLTLARATARAHEIVVRLALGATRSRIVSQLVSESILVSAGGAALGLLLAGWCVKLMLALEPPDIQRPELIEINLAVFAFAAAASVLTILLIGLVPSLGASRADLNSALKAGGVRGGSAARLRSRQFLIAAEVALALIMVTGAGLMLRSFHELISVGFGFETSHLLVTDVEPPAKQYSDPAGRSRLFRQLLDRCRALPGVVDGAVVDMLPLHSVSMSNFYIAGQPEPPVSNVPIAEDVNMSPEYFQAIGLRLEAGRQFTDTDLAVAEKDGDKAAIVNQAFVRKFFSSENPLGKRLLSPDKKTASEIVGVVSDYRPLGVENGTQPAIFWPYLKVSKATLVLRTKTDPQSMTKALQSAIWAMDKDLVLTETGPMEKFVDEWTSQRKFNTLLLGIFAGLALVLAMLGIYGVLSNLVASRTREIGIRMAIGASGVEIGKLVFRQSMIPVTIGLAVGLAGSLVLSRFLEALLFQVHPRDPLTL